MYVRFPPDVLSRELVVWHIVDISRDEFRVRVRHDGDVMVWRRMKPRAASNQTMQPTADLPATSVVMSKQRLRQRADRSLRRSQATRLALEALASAHRDA
jgi:hypothetical protein